MLIDNRGKSDTKFTAMYEIYKEDFRCNLYIDAEEEISTLLQGLATLFNTQNAGTNSISVMDGDILILQNKKFNFITRKSPEDGFLFYRYVVEIKPNRVLGRENAVNFVSEILKDCWEKGFPAIANCEYESELPNKGGYKSQNIPVPR